MFGMGIGVFRNYAQLWQAGYSWRDVLTRPPAPDAIETTLAKGTARLARQLPPPRADEFGAHIDSIRQVQSDRQAILQLLDRLPPSERKMLPEVQQTVNALYERATDVARTLHAMDSNMDTEGLGQIDERIAALAKEPDDAERARRLNLLERQRQTISTCAAAGDRWRATSSPACSPCRTCGSISCASAPPAWPRCSAT